MDILSIPNTTVVASQLLVLKNGYDTSLSEPLGGKSSGVSIHVVVPYMVSNAPIKAYFEPKAVE